MDGSKYPLEQLVEIKKNRLDQALKTLQEKKEILEQEKKTLKKVEAARDEVLQHKLAKLNQLRNEMDAGTTSNKIEQMKFYLKVVEEKLLAKEKKVKEQQKQVEHAEKQVELAKQDMYEKQKDVDKLDIHKKEWEKEMKQWTERKSEAIQDEIGSSIHHIRKKERKKRQ